MCATAAPFVHSDAWAGQTPREHFNGIRKYSILRDANDPAPVLVFDHGDGFVAAGYNDGDDTIVGQVPAASLPRAVYTVGRVVVSHLRYKVDAALHGSSYTLQGEFQNMLVLGDAVALNGTTYNRGHYRYVFHSGVQDYPLEGSTTTLPLLAPGAGIRVTTQGNETVLYFDMNLPVDPDVPQDVHVYMTFNVHEAFRWEDLPTAGYAADVFDASSTGYEPIRQFGANDYTITFD